MKPIKQNPQKLKYKIKAARELAKETSGGELKDKLAAAGVIGNQSSAASILERYKKAE